MKLRTALVLFLLSFFLVGCYSDDLMLPEGNAEPNRMPITDRWATDVVEAAKVKLEAERKAKAKAKEEAKVTALSEEEAKEKLEAAKAKTEEEAKVKLEAERKAKEQAEEEAKIKIAENILKLKALNSCVNCNLSGASLEGVDLRSADLKGADFSGADLSETDLSFAEFSKVLVYKDDSKKFHSFPAYPQRANLKGVNFTSANLKYATLTGVNLTDANLNNAYLFYTNFRNANLTGATLKDAKIEGAIFCNTKTPWGLDNSGCKKE